MDNQRQFSDKNVYNNINLVLNKSINVNKNLKKYFVNKYYLPHLHPKLINKLLLLFQTVINQFG